MNAERAISDEQALREFLLDIECLDRLSPWTDKLNIFDVLRITRAEIRHSNMLAWLLNPNESHGLRDLFLGGVIQMLTAGLPESTADVFRILMMDFGSFSVRREWMNIDLFVVSEKEKFLLLIENKIDSSEHDEQLSRYRRAVEQYYPDYASMYAYLTPEGVDSSIPDVWQTLGYADLMGLLEHCMERAHPSPETAVLLRNYIDAVRRDIVGDERLIRICGEIYEKHRQALDLIFENRPDAAFSAFEIIKKWCYQKAETGEIQFAPTFATKTNIKFTTRAIDSILPEHAQPVSGWKSRSMYFYEIINDKGKVYIKLPLSLLNITEEQRTAYDRLIALTRPNQKLAREWKTIFSTPPREISAHSAEGYEQSLFRRLDEMLLRVQAFERDLMAKWADGYPNL